MMMYDDEYGKLQMFPLLFKDGSIANCQRLMQQPVGVVLKGKDKAIATLIHKKKEVCANTVREHLRHNIFLPKVANKTWRLATRDDFELIKERMHTLNDQLKNLGYLKIAPSKNTYFEDDEIILPEQKVLFVIDL